MLVARGLSAAPPGTGVVVRDFDLELKPGDWVAIGGPNGAGKTTLLLTLAGLWPAAGGVLELDGHPLGPDAPRGRAAVAAVLQDPAGQILQDTVADEIAFAARNLGCPEDEVGRRVATWSGRLGLEGELELDPRTLSAGRQQVVLLASALAAGPAVLFSDEGGAHLDRETRRMVLDTIRAEVRGGLSVVWVTQEEEERVAADRTLSIGDGTGIVAAGDGEDRAGAAAVEAGPARAPSGSGVPLLEISIEPPAGEGGPAIRVGRPIRIAVGPGPVLAIEGPNGAGKSVLLETVAGVQAPPQVRVGLPAGPPPILAAQHPDHQIFAERVRDEVLFAAVTRGTPREEAERLAVFHFEALGLGRTFMGRRTWDLSAAQKRMLQVVGALIAPASVVLLDEPTCGLDADRRHRIARLVRERSQRDPVLVAGQDHGWHLELGATRIELGGKGASVDVKTD